MGAWIFRTMNAFLGALAALAIGEIGLRAFWPQDDVHLLEYRENGLVFNTPSFDGSYSPNPNHDFIDLRNRYPGLFKPSKLLEMRPQMEVPEYRRFQVRTNSSGERDERDHSAAKPAGKFRVLGLGSCVSGGNTVSDDEIYLRRLEEIDPSLETINCGFTGANAGEIAAIYDKLCGRYQSDIAVVTLTTPDGDFRFGAWLGPEAQIIRLLYSAEGERAMKYLHVRDGLIELNPETFTPELQRGLRSHFVPTLPFYHRLNLVRFFENRWSGFREHAVLPTSFTASTAKLLGVEDHSKFGELGRTVTLRYLARLRDSLQKQHTQMLVVIVPSFARKKPGDPVHNPGLARLDKELSQLGIPTLDVSTQLSDDSISRYFNPENGRLQLQWPPVARRNHSSRNPKPAHSP